MSPAPPINIIVADDQEMIRAGLRSILEFDPQIRVIAEASDGDEAVAAVRRHQPDIVLMDVRMPGTDGLEATEIIAADPTLAAVRIIVLTTYQLDEYLFRALDAGASGFLLKTVEPNELRRAVHLVHDGQALLDPAVTARVIAQFADRTPRSTPPEHQPVSVLTDREREVVHLVAQGLTNDEIGTRLFISSLTAKTHVSRAMTKTGTRDRSQLVVYAYRTGLA